jgi:hypothetical protein
VRFALLVLAGCTGTFAATTPIPFDTSWKLAGTAKIDDNGLSLTYCCVAWGMATKPIPAGHFTIDIQHENTDCRAGAILLAPEALARLDGGPQGGRTRLDLDLDMPGELRIVTDGGLHCCGTTTIRSITVSDAP